MCNKEKIALQIHKHHLKAVDYVEKALASETDSDKLNFYRLAYNAEVQAYSESKKHFPKAQSTVVLKDSLYEIDKQIQIILNKYKKEEES